MIHYLSFLIALPFLVIWYYRAKLTVDKCAAVATGIWILWFLWWVV